MSQTVRVVVIGGGYAGVAAANRIASADVGADVVLVNRLGTFVERIRLHQLAAGTSAAAVDFAEVLHPAVTLRVGQATAIIGDVVVLTDGEELSYDYLVYAAGSVAAKPEGMGAAYTVDDYMSALELAEVLKNLAEGARVTVVGGGYTGIETAAEIAESYPALAVRLVSASPVAHSIPQSNRRKLLRGLRKLNVAVEQGVTVSEVSGCTVWAGPFAVPTLARDSGLLVDGRGRLLTDSTLTSVSAPSIVGVGDGATQIDSPVRMSCQAAQTLGVHGAATVLARIAGEEPAPMSLRFVAQCVSLGRRDGLFQVTNRADCVTRIAIGGRAGAWIKEWICASTLKWVRAGTVRR
ncbi:FAD-dependent oxidoreductase [Rhodococcus sp. G-MC3]|uniref:NAD(P)/FAD-dependent oxidoreductase n=1 Tax=Rhodococcus sp. G-MC3 TaxID=3046209 RepID=UPI0024BA251C|nr:FAD-dependent oxidoreductase [Rhodococcus sp. G-MC3]MDJ0392073.1 FAD-dependent oxidoreductase [Rhodococcus sp. G-MC3]